jgi:hypothetical protein
MPSLRRLAALSVLVLTVQSAARSETMLCTEIVPPLTLSVPGSYCLFNDYALRLASGAAITVTANNVTIDLNGHRLGNGNGGAANTATGVAAEAAGLVNLTVRNGTIRGFGHGITINADDSSGHLIEEMLLEQNLTTGIHVRANNSTIRRNRVVGTGTTTTLVAATRGIHANGSENRILDNDVQRSSSLSLETTGIFARGEAVLLNGNRVTEFTAATGGIETGIRFFAGSATISHNLVHDTHMPASGSNFGIASNPSTVKIVGNVVTVPDIGYSGGNQISGTNY